MRKANVGIGKEQKRGVSRSCTDITCRAIADIFVQNDHVSFCCRVVCDHSIVACIVDDDFFN